MSPVVRVHSRRLRQLVDPTRSCGSEVEVEVVRENVEMMSCNSCKASRGNLCLLGMCKMKVV